MKKIFYKFLFLLIPAFVFAQSQDQNYIESIYYKQATSISLSSLTIEQAFVQVEYLDGFGRTIQEVLHKQSASSKDVYNAIEYDAFGRQVKEYLPYTMDSSAKVYDDDVNTNVSNFSQYIGETPYRENQFEQSSLNRLSISSEFGNNWSLSSNHTKKYDNLVNSSNDNVKRFKVNATWNSSTNIYDIALVQNGTFFYDEGTLYKNVIKNENWISGNDNSTQEFINKEGQLILKRNFNGGNAHDTYYVYDQFGNLTYVIPPLAEGIVSTSNLEKLCYQYKFDNRNRLVEKKIPGKQWEFIVYDKLDRPIATGPAYSPFGDGSIGWMIAKYDAFNRPILTVWQAGTVTTTTRKNIQDARNAQTSNFSETKTTSNTTVNNVAFRYSNVAYPTTGYHVLTINYYDDYLFPHANLIDTNVPGATLATNVKGLPTGSWVRVLEGTSDTKAELSYILYDTKYRPVRIFIQNYLGGFTQVDSEMDWMGKILQTKTTHKRTDNDNLTIVTETFEYTPQDRLLTHKHQINSQAEETLTENLYDELGRLILKTTGGGLQDVDYRYNIRGWLTAINDEELAVSQDGFVNLGEGDLFAFKISYDDVLNPLGNTIPLYNGNISETFWKTSTDNAERQYGYEYDALNRLTKANFIKDPFYGGDETGGYDENIEYNKNGNIEKLFRYGKIYSDINLIDELGYTYDGNQLMAVHDGTSSPQGFNDGNLSGDDYDYDDNGNLIFDKNKNIQLITYNHLNLPAKIQFVGGNNIEYLYNAVGQKVKKKVKTGEEYADTDYLSGFQYRSSYTNSQGDLHEPVLQYFPMAEGYVQHVEGRYFYIYNYTDHLGNVRLSYTFDENNSMIKIMEENHYYPFGLKHDNYNTNRLGYNSYTDEDEIINYVLDEQPKFVGDGSYNYKFGNKELQDELGLNFYDFGARNYDPALGRWMNIDPLAETSRRWSPYAYCYSNPIYFVDPDGRFAEGYDDEYGGDINDFSTDPPVKNTKMIIVHEDGTSSEYVFDGKEWVGLGKDLGEGNEVVVSSEKYSEDVDYDLSSLEESWYEDEDMITGVNLTINGLGSFTGALKDRSEWLAKNFHTPYGTKLKSATQIVSSTRQSYTNLAKGASKSSTGLALLSVGVTGYTIYQNNAVKASDILSLGMTYVSTLGPAGMAIGALYFVVDVAVTTSTGTSIGGHLDNSLNGGVLFSIEK